MQTFFHDLIHKTSASIMHMAGWAHGGWHDCSQEEDSITPAPLPLTLSLPSRAYTNCWALGPPNFWSGSMTHLPHVSSTVTKQQSLAIMITSTRLLLKQPVCEIQADAGRKVFFSLIQVQPIFKKIHRPLSDTIVSALILILCGSFGISLMSIWWNWPNSPILWLWCVHSHLTTLKCLAVSSSQNKILSSLSWWARSHCT